MEKRLLTAIILSVAVILVWQFLFPPPKPKRVEKSAPLAEEKGITSVEKSTPLKASEEGVEPPSPPEPGRAAPSPEKETAVSTDLYTATFSSRGARLHSLKLARYRDMVDLPQICFIFPFSLIYEKEQFHHNNEFKELLSIQGIHNYPLHTDFKGPKLGYSADAPYTASVSSLKLDTSTPQGELVFSWTSKEGVGFIKKFTMSNDTYFIDYNFTVVNNSTTPLEGNPLVEWDMVAPQVDKGNGGGFFGGGGRGGDTLNAIWLASDEVKREELKNIQESKSFSGEIKWAGFEEKYFISSLIPLKPQDLTLKLYRQDNAVGYQLVSPVTTIPPQAQQSISYALYLGPKDMGYLEKGKGELGRVLNFGRYLDPFAKPMLFILKLFYKLIPNYGIAIIILSVGIKAIFWPLTHKSQKSMKEMQKIQPKLAEIKEKYKNNKEEQQRKTLEIYRTHKVNPLGGCLPILIQLPVFFALYRVLLNSIELRHAPFISFWINDLSSKDYSYISPILMGASMFIQQKMTPTTTDPVQAKMMLLMPIVFTFMFLSFPSGLVIYWLITNVLSIVQQYYINKHSL
jgi:YidC/Oxa1 family membrane protein insertase